MTKGAVLQVDEEDEVTGRNGPASSWFIQVLGFDQKIALLYLAPKRKYSPRIASTLTRSIPQIADSPEQSRACESLEAAQAPARPAQGQPPQACRQRTSNHSVTGRAACL